MADVEGIGGVGGGEGGEMRDEIRDETRERTRGRVADCPLCGRTLSYTNIARHETSCRVWDHGGGPRS